jgi:hypothetical protein
VSRQRSAENGPFMTSIDHHCSDISTERYARMMRAVHNESSGALVLAGRSDRDCPPDTEG